jgi:threonine dehydrogenase-like Zn-dependent dehydrogenase
VRLGLAGGAVEHAVVVGAGTIGLVTLHAALRLGIGRVTVLEPQEERRARALQAGGEDGDGRGADLVIDAVGAEATRRAAVDLVRPGGTVVCVGLASDDTTLGFHDVVRGQLRIQGSYAYTMDDFEQALAWLVDGDVTLGELPGVLDLDAGPEAFARLAGGPPPPELKVFLAGAGREA